MHFNLCLNDGSDHEMPVKDSKFNKKQLDPMY